MNHYSKTPKSIFFEYFTLVIFLFLFSCSNNDNETPSGISITKEAQDRFSGLASVAHEAERLWPTYDYLTTHPILLLYDEPGFDDPQGYIINAPDILPEGSELVSETQTAGFQAYRNIEMAQAAVLELGEFNRFLFEYLYEGTVYFVIHDKAREGHFYDEYKNVTGGWGAMVLAHELFHKMQFEQWSFRDDWTQNTQDYPFEIELLTWHLYYYDLMADAHLAASAAEAESYARRYVATMSKMQSLDPSEEQLVKKLGTYQELIEGSARYIEVYSALPELYPGVHEDPTHGWRGIIDNATDEGEVRVAIAFRMWYHTGAAATHLLQLLNADVQSAYPRFDTPYELVSGHLNLDSATLTTIQNQIKDDVDWDAYQARAAELMSLV